jgi:ABC-2 type transport system permease protein
VNFDRFWGMVTKEFRQLARDPQMLRVVFLAPVIELLVFGYAVSTDLREARTMVVDHDRTQASRGIIEAVTASGYFELVRTSERPADLVKALERGDVTLALEIPAGFAKDLESGRGATIQVLLDGTNSNTAQVASSYVERILLDHVRQLSPDGEPPPLELEERAWYNPELASRTYNVPATIGVLNLVICLLLTSLAVVREKEIGTLEQLRVSPVGAAELILGKTVPFAVLGLVNLAIVTTIALLWFSIPLRGSVLLLVAASCLYIVCGLAIGLLVSTVSNTQQEAFMSTFMVVMPSILLSGFLFPVSSMPEPVQWITIVNPVRHYIDVVRGIFLKGSGIDILWTQLLALAAIGGILLTLATVRFRRTSI